jgi:hypothetical protein
MRALQALLVDAAEQGLLSRQEAVSMIPPLFLKVCTSLLRACCEQVQAGDTVLDLCLKEAAADRCLTSLLLIGALRGFCQQVPQEAATHRETQC